MRQPATAYHQALSGRTVAHGTARQHDAEAKQYAAQQPATANARGTVANGTIRHFGAEGKQ